MPPRNRRVAVQYEALDMFRRPWGQIWEKYFESGMQRPEKQDALFQFGK